MRYLLQYKIILLITVSAFSCSSYERLLITGKTEPYTEVQDSAYNIPFGNKPQTQTGNRRSLQIRSVKLLVNGIFFKTESAILARGNAEVMAGNYPGAEILYKQVLDLSDDGSAENNLAVLYELTGRKKDSMQMYINALLKSPDNPVFRSNFLSYINHNKFRKEN